MLPFAKTITDQKIQNNQQVCWKKEAKFRLCSLILLLVFRVAMCRLLYIYTQRRLRLLPHNYFAALCLRALALSERNAKPPKHAAGMARVVFFPVRSRRREISLT